MKFLALKITSLKSELEVSSQILREAAAEVEKMFSDKYDPPKKEEEEEDKELEQPSQKQEYQEKEEAQKDQPELESSITEKKPEVKKLFRKISTKIHPDKLQGLEAGSEKDKKTQLYQKARLALEEDDLLTLSEVAMELGLEIPEITEEVIKEAEEKISSIKKEIDGVKSTIVWHWFFAEGKEKKDEILKILFKKMYEQRKNNNPRA